MKKLLLSITIILISFLYFPGAVTAQAVIEIPDKDFNFGDALPGQVFHHTYVVKNSGNVDLIISEVTPSCGCTTALLVDKIVPPGKSVKIEADFTAPMNDGVVKKSINVLTNDPKSPTTIIYLNATVKSDFLIEPKKIDIGEMFIGEKKEFKFTIKPINKKPFEPTQIVFSAETFKVNYKALTPDDPLSTYEFTVEFNAAAIYRPRSAHDQIKIYPYKGNKDLFAEIFFDGKIKGYVQQSASSIFRNVDKGKGFKETVNFKHLKDTPFKIISASSSNEYVTTNIVKVSESNYDVEILLKEGVILNKNGTDAKRVDVMISVKTDQEDSKDMSVYLTFLITK